VLSNVATFQEISVVFAAAISKWVVLLQSICVVATEQCVNDLAGNLNYLAASFPHIDPRFTGFITAPYSPLHEVER
jgi:hypothetical protein